MTLAQQKFIEQIAPLLQKYAVANGYNIAAVPAMIAQACVESFYGSGLSSLASKYYNYWGMKAGSGYPGATVNMSTGEEYTVGTITQIRDNFRVYTSMEDGVKGYFTFLNYPRYAACKTATTPEQYAQYIKAAGWATSSAYVNSIVTRVDTLGLRKYGIEQNVTVKNVNYIGIVTASALKVRSSYYASAAEQKVGTPSQNFWLKKGLAVVIQRESSNGWGELSGLPDHWVSLDHIKKAQG